MTAARLFTAHEKIALALAREYRMPGCDLDDVTQEARIGLWIAARSYDSSRGSFPAFARTVIRRRLANILKTALRAKHEILTRADRDLELVGGLEPDRVVIERDTLTRIVAALSSLTDLERAALARTLNGEAQSKSDSNAVWAARRKLRTEAA